MEKTTRIAPTKHMAATSPASDFSADISEEIRAETVEVDADGVFSDTGGEEWREAIRNGPDTHLVRRPIT